jgi:hypothetical protein
MKQKFGLGSGNWDFVGATQAWNMSAGRRDQLIFHYDFLRPSRTSIHSFDRDPVLDLLQVAEKITIITLATPRSRLIEQLRKGEIEPKGGKVSERYIKLLKLYDTPQFLNDWYNAWIIFTSAFPNSTRMVVANRGEFARNADDDWSAVLESGDNG